MTMLSTTRRLIALVLCATFLLPFYPLQANAADPPKILIDIGQPSIWSLGQAHYLLAKMHLRNKKLSTKFPTDDDLDSNKISASRIDALRSSLGIEGQFDQALGVKNSLALKRLRESETRRESARTDSAKKQGDLEQVNNDLEELNEKIALLEEENRQSQEARERQTPPAPPTEEENQRRKDLAVLRVKKARKEEQRNELKSEITALNTTADTVPAAPTLEEPALTSGNGALPSSETFNSFMEKALREAGKPDLSASMKLDNFIGMQYEIIAKQLTLLRDEVGPDDRVIFLELPASIYTVDKKADGYVAQVEWKVTNYFDTEPSPTIQRNVLTQELQNEGKSPGEIQKTLMQVDDLRADYLNTFVAGLPAGLNAAQIRDRRNDEAEKLKREYGSARPYPITLEMIRQAGPGGAVPAVAQAFPVANSPNKFNVRTIDLIPRQSALNVNQYHATVKETMLLAAFKFLIGFAGKINYQRQREMYEQFVQQEVFASGFGKGTANFGWTYGPQPGTQRIAPGLRTTFAVLVVPRNTLAIQLTAQGKYFKRNRSPEDGDNVMVSPVPQAHFLLSVPGPRTQEFWVEGLSYSPVRKAKRVTAIVDGKYFSPQIGVMVNGVPLEPVVSISRAAGGEEEADVQSADGIAGEYEITNSRQIILSFGMGDSYVGTPNITLTSPEKTTAINFFDLDINHTNTYSSLQERSVSEPMFIEDFNDKLEIEEIRQVPVVDNAGHPLDINGLPLAAGATQGRFNLVRLKGSGMRPEAKISVNNTPISFKRDLNSLEGILDYVHGFPTPEPFVAQESTKSYILFFAAPKDKWKVAYQQLTRQGYEEGSAVKDFASPTFNVSVKNYRFLAGARRAEVDLNILSKTHPLQQVVLDDPSSGRCLLPKLFNPDERIYRVKCLVPADNNGKLERSSILIRAVLNTGGGTQDVFADVTMPVRPVLFSIFNPRTGRSEGFAAEEPTVVISGANLQGVTSVLFGSQKAEVSGASPDSITVKAPKIKDVPKGEAVAVPVILQTAAGQIPSGAIYTYRGEPLPPNILVWPSSPNDRKK